MHHWSESPQSLKKIEWRNITLFVTDLTRFDKSNLDHLLALVPAQGYRVVCWFQTNACGVLQIFPCVSYAFPTIIPTYQYKSQVHYYNYALYATLESFRGTNWYPNFHRWLLDKPFSVKLRLSHSSAGRRCDLQYLVPMRGEATWRETETRKPRHQHSLGQGESEKLPKGARALAA